MAEKEKKEDVKEPKAAAGGNNKLLLIVIVLLVLVLLAVGGLAAYMFLHKTPAPGDAAQATAEHAEVKKKEKKEGAPVFEKMEPFVVNLSGGSSMLQIELQTELADEHAKEKLKTYLPKIRSALILLLSAKSEDELQSADGKIKLKAQIKKIINESMDAGEEELVENVLFTSFIIQQQ